MAEAVASTMPLRCISCAISVNSRTTDVLGGGAWSCRLVVLPLLFFCSFDSGEVGFFPPPGMPLTLFPGVDFWFFDSLAGAMAAPGPFVMPPPTQVLALRTFGS